jgi:hypothetical protein
VYKKLYDAYKIKEKHYVSIEMRDGDDEPREKIEAKLAAGKETLELRDHVNRRFFNFSAQNRSHVKWILKLQSEVRSLKEKLGVQDAESASNPASSSLSVQIGGSTETKVFRALLDPTVPISALSHLPLDSHVLALSQISDVMRASAINKLYFISPSLNDSSSTVLDEVSRESREPDERDFFMRFLLRELLIYKADAEVLAKANRIQSINIFLQESSVEHLESYIRFFEVFQEGRNDTFHLLRDAVCDYLLDSQAPSTTKILGAEVTTEENLRRMTAKGWDVLWVNFNGIVQW